MVAELMKELQGHFDKTVSKLKDELGKVRTGRANSSIFDNVFIDYYGTRTPIGQVGTITLAEPRLFVISSWESNLMGPIEKAIQAAGLGLNPVNDGKVLKVPLPPLSEERRRDMVKVVKKISEDMKIVMRNQRRDANDAIKKLEKEKAASTDEAKKAMEKIQKLTNETEAKIDQLITAKEKEIMTV